LKFLPDADRLVIHPILAEAILEAYGKTNSPDLEYLRKLESVEVGGGKLSAEVANALRDLGVEVVSIPTKICQYYLLSLLNIFSHPSSENHHWKH